MKDTKKKNQLLKLAILRLQNEVEEFKKQEKKEVKEQYEKDKANFFLTELNSAKK